MVRTIASIAGVRNFLCPISIHVYYGSCCALHHQSVHAIASPVVLIALQLYSHIQHLGQLTRTQIEPQHLALLCFHTMATTQLLGQGEVPVDIHNIPAHIKYDGPAPVSSYLQVRPAAPSNPFGAQAVATLQGRPLLGERVALPSNTHGYVLQPGPAHHAVAATQGFHSLQVWQLGSPCGPSSWWAKVMASGDIAAAMAAPASDDAVAGFITAAGTTPREPAW